MASPGRILVVDDNVVNVQILAAQLRSKGYTVLKASSGEEALQVVYAESPDMILLDVMMPGLNGRQVTKQIKSDSKLPFIPIILVTALNELDDKIAGLEDGADEFLTKPVQIRELLAKVQSLLRLKRTQDALVEERNKTALLYRIQQQLSSTLEIEHVTADTVHLMIEAVQAAQGSMIVLDAGGSVWHRVLAREGLSDTEASAITERVLNTGLGGLAIQTRTPQLVVDAEHDERWVKLPDDELVVGSAVAIPLSHADTVMGVLTLTHPEPHHFHEAQLDVLIAATGQVSVALHNASLYSRLREAEAGREQFLHMLTHDLRGPLSGIAGCLHMLGRSADTAEDKLFVELAQQACTTQERLIDDILDVYKAQSGHMELNRAPVSLNDLAAEVTSSLQGAASEHRLSLTVDLPGEPVLLIDRDKILRVLLNLLSNAIKFTRRGEVKVSTIGRDTELEVLVQDTGGGIPTEQIDKIFDRFFQGIQRGARRGTGLGLTFCREVVNAHGGRIWAESQEGVGSTIHFTLPLDNQEAA